MAQLQSHTPPHPIILHLQPLLLEAEMLLRFLPNNEPFKERARPVVSFLRHLLEKEDMSSVDVLELILSKSVVSDEGLREDVESLLQELKEADGDQPIPEFAFMTAALLLLVSYLIDCWPAAVVMSPRSTINFKQGTSTVVINGSDSFALYDHGPEPSIYHTYSLADIIDVLTQLLGAQLSALQSSLCDLISFALRALAPPTSQQQ